MIPALITLAVLAPLIVVSLWVMFGPVRRTSRANVAEYRTARAEQLRLQASQRRRGIRAETPAYIRANRRTVAAARRVSWFRR